MRAIHCILVLLYSRAVHSFRAVPVPLSRHIVSSRTAAAELFMSPAAGDSDSRMEPNEPILLPPADYSKPGSVVNLVGVVGRWARLTAFGAFVVVLTPVTSISGYYVFQSLVFYSGVFFGQARQTHILRKS